MKKTLFIFLLLLTHQLDAENVLDFVLRAEKSHAPKSLNVDSFTRHVSEQYSSADSVAKVYYLWIARNIAYDTLRRDLILSNSKYYDYQEQINDSLTLSRGKALCLGYAHLFQTLMAKSGKRAVMIEGYSKNFEDYVHQNQLKVDHVWNAYLGDSGWQLVDVSWAVPRANAYGVDMFFFQANPSLFILSHFPLNAKWQLMSDTLSKEDFADLPFIATEYFSFFGINEMPALLKKDGKFVLVQHLPADWQLTLNVYDEQLTKTEFKRLRKAHYQKRKSFNLELESDSIVRMDALRYNAATEQFQTIQSLAYFKVE